MKFFLIAGERSGDLHASNLIKALKSKNPNAIFEGFGGDYMKSEGMHRHAHYKEYSVMGFLEVIKNLRSISKYLKLCKQCILDSKPDAVILVDFAGFNMKIAKFCKENGIKVIYYILPKIWAWNTKRAFKIKKNTDLLLSILPFEAEFYKKYDAKAIYVGNPVNDSVRNFNEENTSIENVSNIVAVLPGSRVQEIAKIKQVLIDVIQLNPHLKFKIAGVNNLNSNLYVDFEELNNVDIVYDNTYTLLKQSAAAIVTSGTATLETALLNVPQVVVYKTSGLSYSIAKRLIQVKYISLVNLITNKESVKELIQNEASPIKINEELNNLISDTKYRKNVFNDYAILKQRLGEEPASENAAKAIVDFIEKGKG